MTRPAPAAPTVWQLFVRFALIGLTGFGGVMPAARYQLVEARGWLTPEEFTEVFSLAQFFPGPNVGNVAVIYGRRLHGRRGSLAALTGVYVGPTVLTLAAGYAIARWWNVPEVQHTFGAVMPVASGLMLGTAAKLLRGMRVRWWTIVALVATFALMVVARLPLVVVIVLTAPTAMALAALDRRSGRGGGEST